MPDYKIDLFSIKMTVSDKAVASNQALNISQFGKAMQAMSKPKTLEPSHILGIPIVSMIQSKNRF